MKTVFTNTMTELKKSFTTLSIVLIAIAAISSFFTTIQIFENDFLRTSLQMLYVAASAIGLTVVLLPFLAYLEEYLQNTKFAKFSIASPFIKNARHSLINLKTLLVLISAAYLAISVMTGQVFAAAIIFWFITCLALVFA